MAVYGPWQTGRIHEEIVKNRPRTEDLTRDAVVLSGAVEDHSPSGWYFEYPGDTGPNKSFTGPLAQTSEGTVNTGGTDYGSSILSQTAFTEADTVLNSFSSASTYREARVTWTGSVGNWAQFGYKGHEESWLMQTCVYRFGYEKKLASRWIPPRSEWPAGAIDCEPEAYGFPAMLPTIMEAELLTPTQVGGGDSGFNLYMKPIGGTGQFFDAGSDQYWGSFEEARNAGVNLGPASAPVGYTFDVATMQALMLEAPTAESAMWFRDDRFAYFAIVYAAGWPGVYATIEDAVERSQTWSGGWPDLQVRLKYQTQRYRFIYADPVPSVWPLSDDFEGNTAGGYVSSANTIFTGYDWNPAPFTSDAIFSSEVSHSGSLSITSEPSSNDMLFLPFDGGSIEAKSEDFYFWVYVKGSNVTHDVYEFWRGTTGRPRNTDYDNRSSYLKLRNGSWEAYFDTEPPVTFGAVPNATWIKVRVQYAYDTRVITYTLSDDTQRTYGTASRALSAGKDFAFHLLWTHQSGGNQVFIDDINITPPAIRAGNVNARRNFFSGRH